MKKSLASFRMYTASCTGNAQNTLYPYPVDIASAEDLAAACVKDHVCTEFTNNRRGSDNFIRCHAIQGDCDNDNTEDPAAWITPADVAARLPGVAFYAVKSRNCDKVKHPGEPGEQSARPRWHYYFPLRVAIPRIDVIRNIIARLLVVLPEFDSNGMKPAQPLFGHADPVAEYHDGTLDIAEFLRDHPEITATEPPADDEPPKKPERGQAAAGSEAEFISMNLPDMLAVIPSDDYGDWVRIGMALKAAGADVSVWDEWSKTSAKYPGHNAIVKKWNSFSGGSVTAGTIVHMAQENGWTCPPEKRTGEYAWNPVEWDDQIKNDYDTSAPATAGAIDPETGEILQAAPGQDQQTTKVINGITTYPANPAAAAPAKKPEDNVPDFEEYDSDYFNNTEITPPEPIINEILYPGLGMLGAPAKMGKSYLLLQMAFSVAEGKLFLGFEIQRPGAVLYLDLQGSRARTKQRMKAMGYDQMPKGITIVYKSQKTDTGLFTQIDRWLKKTVNPVLIIIDMMEQVKGSQRKAEDSYRADNRILEPLHDISLKRNISIMVSMHTRKGNKILPDDDPFNEIIGSIAQFGTADCAWMIIGKRSQDTKRFSTICRDNVEGQQDYEVIFTNHRWNMAGTVEDCAEKRAIQEYNKNPVVFTIKKLIDESGGGWYGTMSDLILEVLKRKKDYPATTPEKMYQLVDEVSFRLYSEDGISIQAQSKNGGPKGRRYKFFREQPKQIEI